MAKKMRPERRYINPEIWKVSLQGERPDLGGQDTETWI